MQEVLNMLDIEKAAGVTNGATWLYRKRIKSELCKALAKFIKCSNNPKFTMPKAGNGSNVYFGDIKVHASQRHITIENNFNISSLCISIPMWAFDTLLVDESNSLIIVNGRIAIQYT